MGKKNTKKKKKSGLIKQLSIIIGVVVAVVVIAIVVVNAINKTTIKYITVEGAYSELYIGNPEYGKVEVGISVYPETAPKDSLMAYSADPAIATVNFDGEKLSVEAVGVGTTTITVRHASKSSLYDTMQVTVKDKDVQTLTFVEEQEGGVLAPISEVDIKKDGFEHIIPFNLDPVDANMNNLKVEGGYNTAIFDSVTIDPERKALVVVPKTEIVQTSAEIDVEIYQNTTQGYDPVQVVTLLVNLKNREAYIKFNLSSNPTQGYSQLEYTGNNSSNNNVVYLERSNNASDVYVLPELGYDIDFESTAIFNLADYELYFDGKKINNSDFNSNLEYSYQNKLMVSKSRGNYYYFKTLSQFVDGDCIYVEFVHRYTGASSGLQFIYLDVASMGLASSQGFDVYTDTDLYLGEVVSLNFSYDVGIDRGVVEMYTFSEVDGEKYIFGDNVNSETIQVKKDNKKLSLWAKNLTDGTTIRFGVKCNYWDSRYVRINESYFISRTFTVRNQVTGIHCEVNGKETSAVTTNKNKTIQVALIAEPEGAIINPAEVTFSIIKVAGGTHPITITHVDGEIYEVSVPTDATNGAYKITFTYNGFTTNLYLNVV